VRAIRRDALRLYVMFVAPPEKEVEWNDTGLEGSFRFLGRVWRMVDHLIPALHGAPATSGLEFDEDERRCGGGRT
jgi:leucyl-tRNA synthetase